MLNGRHKFAGSAQSVQNALDVRRELQRGAAQLHEEIDQNSVSALIGLLPNQNSLLRRLAMNALVALGKDATPALLTFLDEHKAQDAARFSAIRALANIGDYQAIPALMDALEEESALIRHWAEEGLVKLGLDMVYMKLD